MVLNFVLLWNLSKALFVLIWSSFVSVFDKPLKQIILETSHAWVNNVLVLEKFHKWWNSKFFHDVLNEIFLSIIPCPINCMAKSSLFFSQLLITYFFNQNRLVLKLLKFIFICKFVNFIVFFFLFGIKNLFKHQWSWHQKIYESNGCFMLFVLCSNI